MLKKRKRFFVPLLSCALLVLAMSISVAAAETSWTSNSYVDWDGVSQVGTTYNSGGEATAVMRVLYGDHTEVGYIKIGLTNGQTYGHYCWGTPLQARYGTVRLTNNYSGSISHDPWFHA